MSSQRRPAGSGLERVGDMPGFESVNKEIKPPTRAERRIVDAAVAIHETSVLAADELAFWPRGLLQCTLPHSNPGAVSVWGVRSGDFYLVLEPGSRLDEQGRAVSYGYPYGSIPRLLIAYLNQQVKRFEKRRVLLGDTLSSFMWQLDLVPTGGRWGSITRLRKQIRALFNARIAYGYNPAGGENRKNIQVSDRYYLWWDTTTIAPHQRMLFPTYVDLGEQLFSDMLEHGVPLDMRALKALKASPLALDFYAWSTYRMASLKRSTPIPWDALYRQFGTGYKTVNDFQKAAVKALRKVKAVYPDLNYRTVKGRLVLQPSVTHVAFSSVSSGGLLPSG